MRVLFAHNRYRTLGGEDLAFEAERELLEARGHKVDLFGADNAEIVGLAGKTKAAVKTVYGVRSKKDITARISRFRPNVVHVHNFFPLLSPSIYYACQEAGVPVTQSLHNFRLICPGGLLLRDGRVCEECVGKAVPWPGVLHGCYRNSWAGSAVVATMLATHHLLGTWKKMVDAYIARTSFSRDKLIEGGLPAEKIGIIPSFAPDPGGARNGPGSFALFVGRLSAEKGIMTLLSAWDRLSGSSRLLKVVGDGPLREEIKQHNGRGRVEYLGALSRDNVQELMREAAFLVFPSDCYENFPLVIAEAFAAGLPVVASGIGAMAEIIDDGRTGLLFRPGDAEDLAAKTEWALGHPTEMAVMRQEARAEYLSKYTPERNYRLLMELYQRAICARHSYSVD